MLTDQISSPECLTNTYNIAENSSNFQSIQYRQIVLPQKIQKQQPLLDYDQMQNKYSQMWFKFYTQKRVMKKTSKIPEPKILPKNKKTVLFKSSYQNQFPIPTSLIPQITTIQKNIQPQQQYTNLDPQTLQLFNSRLNQLNASDSQDLFIIDDGQNENQSKQPQEYLKRHKITEVPMGEKYQAEIPKFLGDKYFHEKYFIGLQRLRNLKVHSRMEENEQTQQLKRIFCDKFGSQRTQQQYFMVRNNYERLKQVLNFEEFLNQNTAKYQQYFNEIDRKKAILMTRALKKKKKTLNKVTSNKTN